MFQPLKPKPWVMAVAAVASFIDVAQPIVLRSSILWGVFMLVNLPCIIAWARMGTVIGSLLTNKRSRTVDNGILGLLLLGSVLPLWT